MTTVNGRELPTMDPAATPWDSDGRTVVQVSEGSITEVLSEGLTIALAASQHACGLIPARGGLSVPIRAEATTPGELFAALLDAVVEELGSSRDALSGVRIDGVLRSDNGLIGWGVVEIARGERSCWAPVHLVDAVQVEERRERVLLSFVLVA